ncbi:aldo/keto reductase [Marinitenerispora sediminis]|uniref:Oxidoreductase n=1 Tax=Marinitenerispora sediminis TaxID=1931232 RepID=A0A368SZ07_9ACTN|nr:aldo/keto reductase [Marinitenerispora sediminis]RCV47826.1 oxidoreductase [Marinitenerispora sediminis]RCV48386.1 oxidoreductase [Marinitenerispora sediminis]RCV50323.1 oxidoreductase [Marinitenerispora sediminis]
MRYIENAHTSRPYSKIGLGTWQFGSREWGYGADYDDREAARLVRRALELGVTVFDTAELYGFGRGERILGAALRTALEAAGVLREEVVVATKILPLLPVAPVVEQRAVASAARLDVGGIDLYQVHQANPVVRDSTTMRGMASLRRAGVIRDVGVSNYSLARWRQAEAALGAPVLANQVQYSLVAREPEHDLLPYAEGADRIVIAYSPLAQGLLSGRYDAQRRPVNAARALNPLFLPDNLERVRPLLDTLREVADAHDAEPSQIALAWAIRHPSVVAIPGAASVEQLESNVAAADIKLTDGEYAALSDASHRFTPVTWPTALPRLLRRR